MDEEAGPGAGPGVADLRNLNFSALQKPKAEIVDCKCEWGLFRDRNVMLRKPVNIRHGQGELERLVLTMLDRMASHEFCRKGWVEQFDGSSSLGWWKPGSSCDAVGGQDGVSCLNHVERYDPEENKWTKAGFIFVQYLP